MRALPTGTVTFLFTDIEGSTRLLQELGDRYAPARDEHAAIIRRAVEEAGGVEVNSAGDSFFVVFQGAPAAVQAAVEDRKSTRLNSSHSQISYVVFCLNKKSVQATRWHPLVGHAAPLTDGMRHRLTDGWRVIVAADGTARAARIEQSLNDSDVARAEVL